MECDNRFDVSDCYQNEFEVKFICGFCNYVFEHYTHKLLESHCYSLYF